MKAVICWETLPGSVKDGSRLASLLKKVVHEGSLAAARSFTVLKGGGPGGEGYVDELDWVVVMIVVRAVTSAVLWPWSSKMRYEEDDLAIGAVQNGLMSASE